MKVKDLKERLQEYPEDYEVEFQITDFKGVEEKLSLKHFMDSNIIETLTLDLKRVKINHGEKKFFWVDYTEENSQETTNYRVINGSWEKLYTESWEIVQHPEDIPKEVMKSYVNYLKVQGALKK